MKNRFFLLLAVLFVFAVYSCNKDEEVTEDNTKVHGPQTLPGSWECRSYYGGFSATGGGTTEPGKGDVFVFTDKEYIGYASGFNGTRKDSGTYELTRAINPNTGEEMQAIVFDGHTESPMCFSIENDELTLHRGAVAFDGTVETYVRIANAGDTVSDHN